MPKIRHWVLLLCLCLPGLAADPGNAASQPPDNVPGMHVLPTPDDPVAIKDMTGLLERLLERTGKHVPDGWLTNTLMNVPIWRYVVFAGLVVCTFAGGALLRWFLEVRMMRLAARTAWDIDDLVFTAGGRPARVLFLALGLYLSLMVVLLGAVPEAVVSWWSRLCLAVCTGSVFWYIYRLVDVLDHYLRRVAQRTDNDLDNGIVDVIRKSVRIVIAGFAFIYIGNNVLKWDITALLASAGVAGLAVAFAAQDTIANFFGTLMLLVDRPFKVGDRIKLEGSDGPVESIGFRSTRIRTMEGNQVSIPNKTAANATVENVARRPYIKHRMTIGVTYDTSVEKMHRAVEIIRDILTDHEGMDAEWPPRVYFHEFADYSLNISVTAWYHPADYWQYMAWVEKTNFTIMERFDREGIEFAFPTSTTYLAQDNKRALTITTVSPPPNPS